MGTKSRLRTVRFFAAVLLSAVVLTHFFHRIHVTSLAATWTSVTNQDPASVAANPGQRDTTFGTAGRVLTPIGADQDNALDVALQSDGKIVCAGIATNGTNLLDFAVTRHNRDGSLDTTFDSDGKLTTSISNGTEDYAEALALQTDGKIVVAGHAHLGTQNENFVLVRYNADGSLDANFGSSGKVVTSFGPSAYINDVALQSNGKIVVVGSLAVGSSSDFAIFRYNSDGTRDQTFGTNGLVTTDFATRLDSASALQILPDGKIIVGGFATVVTQDFGLAKYNADGSLDTTFGSGGKVTHTMAPGDHPDNINALKIQPDGKIVATGTTVENGKTEIALARYLPNGALDTSFDADGKVIKVLVTGFACESADVAIEWNDKIIVGGYTVNPASGLFSFALARFHSNGSPDMTFVSDISGISTGHSFIGGIAIDEDGKIIAAGTAYTGSNSDFGLARYFADPLPTLSISDVATAEGNNGVTAMTFSIALSQQSNQTVRVQGSTVGGTAQSGIDFVPLSTSVTFSPGQTSRTFTVNMIGDVVYETDETMRVLLGNPLNATIADNSGTGTIVNDDAPPAITINDVTVVEGDAGASNATFTVSLSGPSALPVGVIYNTANGSATAGSDYSAFVDSSLTFNPGEISKPLNIPVIGDTLDEDNENFFVNLSLPTGASIADAQGVATIIDNDGVAPAIAFSSANYTVNEGATAATLTVNRVGSTAGSASVNFSITSIISYVPCENIVGFAAQNCDYIIAGGTLSFAPGETSKTITLLIVDDLYVEGNEVLNLSLAGAVGTPLGTPASTVLNIIDNDTVVPGTNPSDDAQFFVREHYFDFLSRIPDPGGLGFWSGRITECGTDPNCIHSRHVDVSNAFFYELEFQQTGAYVYRLYRAAYGNDQPAPNPDTSNVVEARKIPSYATFVRDRSRVVAGTNLAQAQLEVANLVVQRPEFIFRYPGTLSGPQYVDALLARIANDTGVNLISERTALINLFNTGGRGAVLYRLADDNLATNPVNNRAFIDAEYNRSFVYTQYAGYLRRDADIGGLLFWLGQVNAFPVRDTGIQHTMVCAFITSGEYQKRFSPIVTRSNADCIH